MAADVGVTSQTARTASSLRLSGGSLGSAGAMSSPSPRLDSTDDGVAVNSGHVRASSEVTSSTVDGSGSGAAKEVDLIVEFSRLPSNTAAGISSCIYRVADAGIRRELLFAASHCSNVQTRDISPRHDGNISPPLGRSAPQYLH